MRKPKLGQVFLIDHNIIGKILKSVSLVSSDTVIEIGCGDGILSQALLQHLNSLIIIEIDQKCIDSTKNNLNDPDNIHWVHNDVLNVDFSTLSQPIKVVANIPYYLSSKLIQHFVSYKSCFKDIVIMVQKEFALKCKAKPKQKDYTSLSVFTQLHFNVDYLFDISRNSFSPIPAVDSAMIRLSPKQTLPIENLNFFEMIVKACFWGKRKKLQTCLLKNPHLSLGPEIKELAFLKEFGHFRADQLSLNDYLELYNELLFVLEDND